MRPSIRATASQILAVFLLSACAQIPSQGGAPLAGTEGASAQGRQIAVSNCSTCHAIDNDMASPNPNAPPLLSILMRYDSERLAEDFVEGVRVGHDEMPHFTFTVREADALVAYLKDIERTPRAAER